MTGRRDWGGRCAAAGRRIAGARYSPALLGVLLAALAVAQQLRHAVISASSGTGAYGGTPPSVLVLLAVLTTLPLGLLWTQPAAAALAVDAASVLSLALFGTLTAGGMAGLLIALYRLGRFGSSQLLAAGLAMPFLVIALADAPGSPTRVLRVLLAALAPVAAWSGIARRARREVLEHSAERQLVAGTLLEHTARGERARISRELHDVVAHHISMIAVQAETARLTTPGMPTAGAQRLSAIGDTARAALTEMRRLLGVLREDTRFEPANRRPQPGLRHLNELLDEARDASAAGVRLIVRGPVMALDPGVELAGYRIVQEAVTNARRHAPGAAVDVELQYCPQALRLRIRDNGPGPPRATLAGGHGLLGMHERAAAVGGSLRAGQATSGGFLVEATLPTISPAEPTGVIPLAADTAPPAEPAMPAVTR